MKKTNGYSFVENETVKTEKSKTREKVYGTFIVALWTNMFIWVPVFAINEHMKIVVPIAAVVSVVLTLLIIRYFKKRWDNLVFTTYTPDRSDDSFLFRKDESWLTSTSYSGLNGNIYHRKHR